LRTSAGVRAVQSTSIISSSKTKCFRHVSMIFACRAQPGYQIVSKESKDTFQKERSGG
jgi:hypothetical protein